MQSYYEHLLEHRIKQGAFQSLNMIALWMLIFLDGSEIMILTYIIPIFQQIWHISLLEKSLIAQTIFIGMMLGCIVGGPLADRLGRKPVIILSILIVLLFGILSTFAQNITQFILLRCACTVGHGMGSSVTATYSSEINTNKYRGFFIIFGGLFFPLGALYVSIIALFCLDSLTSGNWRLLTFLSSLGGFIALALAFFIKESPRWCLAKQHYSKAFDIINHAIKTNASRNIMFLQTKPIPISIPQNNQIIELKQQVSQEQLNKQPQNQQSQADDFNLSNVDQFLIEPNQPLTESETNKLQMQFSPTPCPSIKTMFQKPLLKITLVLSMLWFGVCFLTYGTLFIFPYILQKYDKKFHPSNQYTHQHKLVEMINSAIPVIILTIIFMVYSYKHPDIRFNRFIPIQYLVTGILLSLSLLNEQYMIILFVVARSIYGNIFTCCYIFTAQCYETRIRSTAYGMLSFVARIGGMVMPGVFFSITKSGVEFSIYVILLFTGFFGIFTLCLPQKNSIS